MLNKRQWILASIVLAVMLSLSVTLSVAQEEPPVQPATVDIQAGPMEAWNQLETPIAGSDFLLTVPSYEERVTTDGNYGASIAADDFVLTNTGDVSVTAWFLSQVIVRAQIVGDTTDKASICFYGDDGGKPSQSVYACAAYDTTNVGVVPDGDYRTVTYNLTSSPLLSVNTRYWLSVKMTDLPQGVYWYWRVRSAVNPNTPYAFANRITGNFNRQNWSASPCYNKWQVQTGFSSACYHKSPDWPYDHDLLFKLVGRTFHAGEFTPKVYLPLIRR